MPDAKRRLENLSDAELSALMYDWKFWARPEQILPTGNEKKIVFLAGRGWGKTRTGAEAIRQWHNEGFHDIGLIVCNVGDLQKTWVNGRSGLLAVCPPDERPRFVGGDKRYFVWPNGDVTNCYTAEKPDTLRGPQHEKLVCDELAKWRYDKETWTQAMLGLRIGSNPQAMVLTTPRPTPIIRELSSDPKNYVVRGTSFDNRANLSDDWFDTLIKSYEGTRIGRQELYGEILEDNPGALWTQSCIESARVDAPYPLTRIVVAIDPAVTSNEESDETGIVVVGIDGQNPEHMYVLQDDSGIYTPREWASRAIMLYRKWEADRIIGEVNQGGDMVESTLRNVDPNIPYTSVRATRGKELRAEPVSALYEQGRVHHVGRGDDAVALAKLEDQMVNWNPQTSKDSPDRVDALVWACTELASGSSGAGWIQFYKGEAINAQRKGYIEETVDSKVRVDGVRTDVCSMCGSTFFTRSGNGKDTCFSCGAERPTADA
jgi:phage terminase large subunit-like protein